MAGGNPPFISRRIVIKSSSNEPTNFFSSEGSLGLASVFSISAVGCVPLSSEDTPDVRGGSAAAGSVAFSEAMTRSTVAPNTMKDVN
jgi:hypothetical protein